MCKLLFLRLWHSTHSGLLFFLLSSITWIYAPLRALIRILPISIIKEFNLDLDEFSFMHKYPDWAGGEIRNLITLPLREIIVCHLTSHACHFSVPIYAIPVWLGLTKGPTTSTGYNQTEIVETFLSVQLDEYSS